MDMDEADDRAHDSTWSFRYLENVMVGATRPLEDVARWASGDFDAVEDDDELYKMHPPGASLDDDDAAVGSGSWFFGEDVGLAGRGWARRRRRRPRPSPDAAATWATDDDVETLPPLSLSDLDRIGVGAWFAGVSSWVADRRERARAAAAAAAEPPPLEVVPLDDDARRAAEIGCDEMHFLPVPDSGWSVALLRYRPRRDPAREALVTQPVSSTDGAWDDSDFYRSGGDCGDCGDLGSGHDAPPTPVLMVPGCASNAYTFDVAPGYSLARYLAERGHDTWIVECRGVGFSRPWRKPAEWVDAKTRAPRQHTPTWGDFDFDTYLREDLPVAAGYVANVTGSRELAGVGHSMGGMLVMALAAGAADPFRRGPGATPAATTGETNEASSASVSDPSSASSETRRRRGEETMTEPPRGKTGRSPAPVPWSEWEVTRAVAVASCLECSDRTDVDGHRSTYAQLAGLAGVVPDYLYGGSAIPQLPLGPLSVGQGMAIEAIKGAPREDDSDDSDSDSSSFWRNNAVSLSTCYPGATAPKHVRQLLLKGFGNVPLRLVLQMATLFAPGGLSTREEAVARRERAVRAAKDRQRREREKLRGWGDPSDVAAREATVAEVVDETMRAGREEGARGGPGGGHVHYIDALRAKRPRLAVLAGDCDPVIPPRHSAATAAAAGGEFRCFGDGPKTPSAENENRDGDAGRAGEREGRGRANDGVPLDGSKTSAEGKKTKSDPDATLRSMLSDGGEHFSHYDLLCGRRAPELVFPVVAEFIEREGFFEGIRRRMKRAARR